MTTPKPAFYGFMDEENCCVHLCFTPSAPRHDGVYATAYYTTPAPTAPAGGEAPVAWYDPANKDPGQSVTFDKDKAANWPHLYRVPLYTHPSADLRGAAEQALEALKRMNAYAARQTCSHDETYRGGAIWTICRQCGMKWADDEGGKPPYEDPPEMIAATAAIASLEAAISRKGKTE